MHGHTNIKVLIILFWTDFGQSLEKYSNVKFMKNHAVRTEVFHADGRTDRKI